jgi:hypothetical protein
MADEKIKDEKRFVRFDFPPGAGPAEIAAAIEAARRRLVADYAERQRSKGATEQSNTITRPASPPAAS